jgi:hypothetical protein
MLCGYVATYISRPPSVSIRVRVPGLAYICIAPWVTLGARLLGYPRFRLPGYPRWQLPGYPQYNLRVAVGDAFDRLPLSFRVGDNLQRATLSKDR